MESTTLVAPDISCEHCQHAIEGAVGKIGGVTNVTVDIPAKTVHVDYDPQIVTQAKIEEVLDDAGYTVAKEGPLVVQELDGPAQCKLDA